MADVEQVALLKQGVEAWNRWRSEGDEAWDRGEEHPGISPDLSRANLIGANLIGANLQEVDLTEANLTAANLTGVNLTAAKLIGANLMEAKLCGATLMYAYLMDASLMEANLNRAELIRGELIRSNLTGADLTMANLTEANLTEADLSEAKLDKTVFGDSNLSNVEGLDRCRHAGPSIIDHRTLQQSGPLPLAFLRGVGLPDNLIDYLPSLLNQPIQFFSCFISYSSKDQEFADRLHADLQNKGVRCWFAPHDMPIGAKIIDAIDEAIRLRDKVLLILSEHSVASDWVEEEVTRALAEERSRKTTVLFPIRVDDAVLNTSEAWARGLRIQRNIGDFCLWKDHDAYQKVLGRVLRDLKMAPVER